MDNINLIRVGFYAPEFKISDTDGEMDDPIDRSGKMYTCLAFINPDDNGAALINDLENNLPPTASGLELSLSAIVPVKLKPAKKFKEEAGFNTRLFCDSDLRAGTLYSIVDSLNARPTYHPLVFVIGDEGSVRYRQSAEPSGFDIELFRSTVSELI